MSRKKRQPVDEEELKFHLLIQKGLFQLKELKNKTQEELETKWEKKKRKRINLATKHLSNPKWSSEIAQKTLKHNIEYTKNMPIPDNKELILENFEKARENYLDFLYKNDKENKKEIEFAKKINLLKPDSETNNKFGYLIEKLIANRMKSPNFASYHNWDIEFRSDAIEKILKYLENFDTNILSPRTGKTPLAFAYITSITNFAFISVINKFKEHEKFIKEQIKMKTDSEPNLVSLSDNKSNILIENNFKIHKSNFDETEDDFEDFLLNIVDKLNELNDKIETNNNILAEIYSLQLITPEHEKNNLYYQFIKDLEHQVDVDLPKHKYEEIHIYKSPDIKIKSDYDVENFRLRIINF